MYLFIYLSIYLSICSKDGNFVWNEKKDDVKDAWLDDVDWVKVI